MPIYEYHCTSCEVDHEIFQRMSDDALTDCPDCGGTLKKIFSAVGIVFKGSGFYATDSKKSSTASRTSSPPASTKPDGGQKDTPAKDSSSSTSDTKPAATQSTPTSPSGETSVSTPAS
jgi:putative FmdB family regulatory protein